MKRSTEIYNEHQTVLARLRALNAEFDTCAPIARSWRLSPAEEDENNRRATRRDQISNEIGKGNAEAARLRKEYSDAMAEERRAAVPEVPVSDAMAQLLAQRNQHADALMLLQAERVTNALAAAGGDKEALAAMEKIAEKETHIWRRLEDYDVAKLVLEARESEVRKEFAQRAADAKHSAGQAAVDPLLEWSSKFQQLLNELAAHYGKLPALRTALMKSGADVNTDLSNRLFIKAANDRAAKAAGLHHVFSIDATVTAAPLDETFKSVLRAAVRRPTVKDNAA